MVKKIIDIITEGIKTTLDETEDKEIEEFINYLRNSKTIFIAGAGRSGLVGKAFAMRLMHLGYNVFVVGETITPSVRSGELLITISGSGETNSTVAVAQTAKKLGIKTITITSYENSTLAKLSDCVVKIKGRKYYREKDYESGQLTGQHEPLTPLGTMFELSVMIFLDSLIAKIMEMSEKHEKELGERHANLE
jgi:6-phospho-3-hexuloisomerase